MMKVADYIRRLASADENERINVVESINIQNYAMNMLSETDMWILRTAAENVEYLNHKLKEAETSTLGKDLEAPEEELLTLDDTNTASIDNASTETEETELSLDDTAETDTSELSLDDTAETDTSELSLDDTTETEETELSLGDTSSEPKEEKDEKKIETSIEGVGILPLLAEIQEKLANGKPSEIELAALKAMKKLF
jgi:hypothetical protein